MRESHKKQTIAELRTAFEAGRLSAYFDRLSVTAQRVGPLQARNERSQGIDHKGEEWHH